MLASEVLRGGGDSATKSSSDTYLGIVVHGRCRGELVLTRSRVGRGEQFGCRPPQERKVRTHSVWAWTLTSLLIHLLQCDIGEIFV